MNDMIDHPPHYVENSVVLEPIAFTSALDFCLGNAIKYIFRAGCKEGASELEDLEKARWYLNWKGVCITSEKDEFPVPEIMAALKYSSVYILKNSIDIDNKFYWAILSEELDKRIEQLRFEQERAND